MWETNIRKLEGVLKNVVEQKGREGKIEVLSRTKKVRQKCHRIIEVGIDLWRSFGSTSFLKQIS